jgi:hypothetical protein
MIEQLTKAYHIYFLASSTAAFCDKAEQNAAEASKAFIDYFHKMKELYPHWDFETAVNNQIRVIGGWVECYINPTKAQKNPMNDSRKTRRWL